jgi:hypothetical protein
MRGPRCACDLSAATAGRGPSRRHAAETDGRPFSGASIIWRTRGPPTRGHRWATSAARSGMAAYCDQSTNVFHTNTVTQGLFLRLPYFHCENYRHWDIRQSGASGVSRRAGLVVRQASCTCPASTQNCPPEIRVRLEIEPVFVAAYSLAAIARRYGVSEEVVDTDVAALERHTSVLTWNEGDVVLLTTGSGSMPGCRVLVDASCVACCAIRSGLMDGRIPVSWRRRG